MNILLKKEENRNMSLYNNVVDMVKNKGLDISDFQVVVSYLLENGIICREDNKKEALYYDYFVRFEDIVHDYLNLIGIQLVHDDDLFSIRLYAPNSDTPESFEDEEVKTNMSMAFTSEESAYLITLAIVYDQKLREGDVTDEVNAEIDLEEFNTALATHIGFTPSEKQSVREDALKTLKRLRVVTFAKGVFVEEDRPLIIRPHIKQIILPSMIHPYTQEQGGYS